MTSFSGSKSTPYPHLTGAYALPVGPSRTRGDEGVERRVRGFELVLERLEKMESRMDVLRRRDGGRQYDPEEYVAPDRRENEFGEPARREFENAGRFPPSGVRNRCGLDCENRRDNFHVGGYNMDGYQNGYHGGYHGGYQVRGGRQPTRRGETVAHNRHNRRARTAWDPPWYGQDTWEDEDQYDDRRPTCWHPPLRTHVRHVEEIRAHPLLEPPPPPPQYTPIPYHQPSLVKNRRGPPIAGEGSTPVRPTAAPKPSTEPPEFQPIRVSHAERSERSRRGLCWHCPEKWSVGHVCKAKILCYEGEDGDETVDLDSQEDANGEGVDKDIGDTEVATEDTDPTSSAEAGPDSDKDSETDVEAEAGDTSMPGEARTGDTSVQDGAGRELRPSKPMMMELESRKIGCLTTNLRFEDRMDGIQGYTKEMRKRDTNYQASHVIYLLQPEEARPSTYALPRFLAGKWRQDLQVVHIIPFDPGGKISMLLLSSTSSVAPWFPHALIRGSDGLGTTTREPAAPLKEKLPDLFLEDKEDSKEGRVDTSTPRTPYRPYRHPSADAGPRDDEASDPELDVPEPGAADTSVRPEVSNGACTMAARCLWRGRHEYYGHGACGAGTLNTRTRTCGTMMRRVRVRCR